MKRTSSLVGRPSPFHANVTVYETSDEITVRRSKRLKLSTPAEAATSHAHSSLTKPPQSREEDENAIESPRKVLLKSIGAEATQLGEASVSSTATSTADVSVRPKSKRNASPRKPRPVPTALETPHPAPPRWQEAYDTIKCMRSRIIAPVDTMGCEQAQFKETDPKVCFTCTRISMSRFHCPSDEHFLLTEPAFRYSRIAHVVVPNKG